MHIRDTSVSGRWGTGSPAEPDTSKVAATIDFQGPSLALNLGRDSYALEFIQIILRRRRELLNILFCRFYPSTSPLPTYQTMLPWLHPLEDCKDAALSFRREEVLNKPPALRRSM
jgi:hypothetical protein